MKKTLALVLAGVMAAGMTTVAFADLKDTSVRFDEAGTYHNYIIVDANDDNKFDTKGEDHDHTIKDAQGGVFAGFAEEDGGKKVAIPLYDNDGAKLTDESELKGWRINADWTVGDLDEKPDFDYVRVNGVYQCVVSFVLPDSDELKSTDLAGSITIYKSSTDNRNPVGGTNKITFGVEYGYTEKPLEGTGAWDDLADAEIVVFKDGTDDEKLEGEYNLVFGDYFEFEVDVTGQGKLNLKNNQDFNKEFAAMYDYANIDFITFEYEPSFNKIGTAWIYAPEDAFIYEVTADGAKAIKGLEWDEDYEAWTFRTRTLGAYAISDVELDEKTVTEDKDDTTTDDGKVNPDTGR